MRRCIAASAALWALVNLIPSAVAHVTIQPSEAPAGSFFRFVVRVPTEREDASTTRVQVTFPEDLVFVSFQPKAGWKRQVTMKKLDEPVEVSGARITEVVDTVTWSGGAIRPGEFDEFGFSARVPDDPASLRFSSIQTYSSGERVRWTGAPESDTPAPLVNVVALDVAEGEGELAVLSALQDEVGADDEADDGDGVTTLLAGAAALLALAALGVALANRRRS